MAALPLTAKHRQRIWFLRASSQVSAETGSAPKIFPSYPALTLPCSRCTPSQRAKAPLWVDPDVSPCMAFHFHCCPQSLLHAQLWSELLHGAWMWISLLLSPTWERSSPWADVQAMGFSLHSEPDGRAGEVKSNSPRPIKQKGAVSVGGREGSWCSRPFGNCSKGFGYKKYKRFWEHPGPCCSSPARANSWILHKTCWCRSPPLCGLLLQNSEHKTLKQWKYKTNLKLHFQSSPPPLKKF